MGFIRTRNIGGGVECMDKKKREREERERKRRIEETKERIM